MNCFVHLSCVYHLPSWQGGKAKRALCHGDRVGILGTHLTRLRSKVTCPCCQAIIKGKPTPANMPRVRIAAEPVRARVNWEGGAA